MRKVLAQVLARVACASCLRELLAQVPLRKAPVQALVCTKIRKYRHECLMHSYNASCTKGVHNSLAGCALCTDSLARALREWAANTHAHTPISVHTYLQKCVNTHMRTYTYRPTGDLLARALREPCASLQPHRRTHAHARRCTITYIRT